MINKNDKAKHCDECGREVYKIFRSYKGVRYCGACYKRIFKSSDCPKCGSTARLSINDPKAICIKCEKSMPCARCGKVQYKIGKMTQYGPVCSNCSYYFRKPKPCGICGTLSRYLSRTKQLIVDVQVCPKCARQNHGTCSLCSRYRPLFKSSDDNYICKLCLEKGEVLCQKCHKLMPAGRGKVCDDCYWKSTFLKRLKINISAFSTTCLQNVFSDFGEWLMCEISYNKAALSINRYLLFFLTIERQWGEIPCYNELLVHFSAEGLRRVQLPMRWLSTAHNIIPDTEAKKFDSETRRINSIMSTLKRGTPGERILTGYFKILMKRFNSGKTKIQSVRLALNPVISLILMKDKNGRAIPDQKTLNRYMLQSPGQKASITGFLNYLHTEYGVDLTIYINRNKVNQKRRDLLGKKLWMLTQVSECDDEILNQWLTTGLEYFHGVKLNYTSEDIQRIDDGYVVKYKQKDYFLPYYKK